MAGLIYPVSCVVLFSICDVVFVKPIQHILLLNLSVFPENHLYQSNCLEHLFCPSCLSAVSYLYPVFYILCPIHFIFLV